ncbi:aminopeptidase P family N-terminal domain-containing protein [Mesorhizobium sp. M1143]|uniref:aminopeptidase P family N-terminal domain-containing protein n=1 Tax=Mesorhizobium sp. M1143 TaxID=2957061 RepID=UPI003334EC16
MPVSAVALKTIDLPEFGEPTVMPLVQRRTYEARIEALLARGAEAGLDAFAVYGDREHAANVAYLSGYDPRFEETLLVIVPGSQPKLLVGNEGWGYAEICDGPYQRVLYQTFSLPAQPRDRSASLSDTLAACGLKAGQKIGAIGWKPFGPGDGGFGETTLDLPSFIADTLRTLAGDRGAVVNAANLLMNPSDGLRAINEADQLASFEFAATFSSQGLRNVLGNIEPGMSELQAARLMGINGLPLCCHPMLSAGRRAPYGLPSPPRHHQARRSRHHGLWHPGLAQRPRRLPGRERGRTAARDKRLCRTAGSALFRRRRRLVRDHRHRRCRRSALESRA